MIVNKLYKYIGYNGTITSPVLLPNIDKLEVYELKAANGKILTNGIEKYYSVIVTKETQNDWIEIMDEVIIE